MADERNTTSEESFEAGDTLDIPTQFLKALADDQPANDAFDRLPAIEQRAFIDWVVEAKSGDVREERAREALTKLREGRRATD